MKLVVAIIKPHQVEAVTERTRQDRGLGHDAHGGARPRSPARTLRGVPRRRVQGRLPAQGPHRGARRRRRRPSRWRTRSSTTPAPARSATASSGSSRSTWRCGSAPARSVTKRSDAARRPPWRGLVADHDAGRPRLRRRPTPTSVDELAGRARSATPAGVALLAVGAYGRRELCPASDLDLVLVHDGGAAATSASSPTGSGTRSGTRASRSTTACARRRRRAPSPTRPQGRARPARRAAWSPATRVLGERAARPASATTGATGRRKRLPALDDLVAGTPPVVGRRRVRARARSQGGTGRQPRRHRRSAPSRGVTDVYVPDERLGRRGRRRCSTRASRCSAVAGRTDRLLLEHQDDVAGALGLADADELMARVSGAARTIALAVGRRVARGAVVARRARGALGGRTRRAAVARARAARRRGRAASPTRRPPTTPRSSCGPPPTPPTSGVPIARPTLRRFDAEPGRADDPWAADTRDAFVALLGGGDAAVPQVEVLDQHGLLVQFLPEWDVVRCLPQRNAFHRFTVDRHLLEAGRARRRSRAAGAPARPPARGRAAARPGQGRHRRPHRQRRGAGRARSRPAWASTPPTSAVLVDLVRQHLLLPSYRDRPRPRRSGDHRRGGRRGRHRGHARSPRTR